MVVIKNCIQHTCTLKTSGLAFQQLSCAVLFLDTGAVISEVIVQQLPRSDGLQRSVPPGALGRGGPGQCYYAGMFYKEERERRVGV